jgi:O-antigen/teichoic acid export membrane protein
LRKFAINNILGLQIFQVLRFVSFLIISIVFTKSSLSLKQIGDWELLLFIAGALSFFWITGIIQSLLPLFNNSDSYPHSKEKLKHKSPEIFNAFILLLLFSMLLAATMFFFKNSIMVYKGGEQLPYANFLIIYLLFSSPACLIEYIYLLYNKATHILMYGFIIFTLQTLFVVCPVIFGYEFIYALWGLTIITIARFIWLLVLLKKYTQIRFSWVFIKEHISLAVPLVISTLLSGSAQYIDGLIVSSKFSPEKFAIFRYGAKEMPLVATLASGLNNAMLTQFGIASHMKQGLLTLKKRSVRLMHILFPISILLLFCSDIIFPAMFTDRFGRSSSVFMVYVLLILSRLLFPQTILIGLKKTKVVMIVSIIAIVLNIALSLAMIPTYGIVGVAVATVIIYLVEKTVLIAYNYYNLGIKPKDYIPLTWYFIYSCTTVILFVLIDHKIIYLKFN